MSDFTDAYVNLLIKQYWEKSNARGEIAAQAATWEKIRDIALQFVEEFDIDNARGHRLDLIGKLVGLPRRVPFVVAKIAFGFADNPNARGFGDKFGFVQDVAPFQDKFEPARTGLELNDADYRFFLKVRIAQNNATGVMVSDSTVSIQAVINQAFGGDAYVIDRQDMTLGLYVSEGFDDERLRVIRNLELLPKPQGVRYYPVVSMQMGTTFGFSDNPDALGFADKFNAADTGGYFANKVI